MIGLDTNVLVRYLTRDDPAQFERARKHIAAGVAAGERFVISSAVLCELAWVLRGAYRYSRAEIARAIERMLATAEFDIEHADEARQALEEFRSTKADFSDALIGRVNRSLGAAHTATFDRDLAGLDTFHVL